ncbi:MAG: RsmF rRNA methyltransferase first C-terminal domain-containing protein, partial [Lachnospiraceae bacterium]|nr:RsmF rRNA methyltransferase first C-terminal domain-containing protein [Lachnospiraceae bacterium]
MLPIDFTNRMKDMLKDEYDLFVSTYNNSHSPSLRINQMKTAYDTFSNNTGWQLDAVPWCSTGFYYSGEIQPGKHPYHEGGAYYIQEASAMLPATLLDAQPGDIVLDLCAAPGGKSTQIACDLNGQGLLISNEIIPNRAKILSENIERLGIKNAIVTNEDSFKLADHFPSFFDKIMVDAPCSGEGMFRKNSIACDEWSLDNVDICANRQLEILDNAASMLKSGGRIVYSTCTFAPAENEGTIARFLAKHPDFSLEKPCIFCDGFDSGHNDWVVPYTHFTDDEDIDKIKSVDVTNSIRLWPHKINGEGHFAAVLLRAEDSVDESIVKFEKGINPKELKEYLSFEKTYLNTKIDGSFVKFGDQLFVLPNNAPSLKKLKVLRPGLHLGTFLKNRFEPSHALALALNAS